MCGSGAGGRVLSSLVFAVLLAGCSGSVAPTPAVTPSLLPTVETVTLPAATLPAATSPTATPAPIPKVSVTGLSASDAEAALLAMAPSDVRCWFEPDGLLDSSTVAALNCEPSTRPPFSLSLYTSVDEAKSAYESFAFDLDCPDTKIDGDLIVGGSRIGSAGGCTDSDFFSWTVDALGLSGFVVGSSFVDARAYFVEHRFFPVRKGNITGPAFKSLPKPAPTQTPAPTPKPTPTPTPLTYADIFRNNSAHQGESVTFTGEVEQYTLDPTIPFVVLVHVGKDSLGLYTTDPIGLTHYTGKPLLRGDMVEFTGTVGPLVTYDSLTGSRTIPTVSVTESHLLQ